MRCLFLAALLVVLQACSSTREAERNILSNPAAYKTSSGGSWTRLDNGSLEVRPGTGNLITTEEFGDARFTVEFRCPHTEPTPGTNRDSSGIFIQGRYEVQILDSFAAPLALNSCGSIYNVSAPLENACLTAGAWQSFVIDFTAARFDDTGRLTKSPRMSIWHNGTQIHDDIELFAPTPGGLGLDVVARGPLMLQDAGQEVRFRNLIVTPKERGSWNVGVSFGAGVLTD